MEPNHLNISLGSCYCEVRFINGCFFLCKMGLLDFFMRRHPAEPAIPTIPVIPSGKILVPTAPLLTTVCYTLESRTRWDVEVLEVYCELARGLIDHLVTDDTSSVYEAYPILIADDKVLYAYANLCSAFHFPEMQPLPRDMVYLTVCRYGARKEGAAYASMSLTLDGVIRELDR